MNKLYLIGNVSQSTKTGQTNKGTMCCKFSVAVNTKYGEEKRTDFFPIVTFGKLAEVCDKYVVKGMRIAIVGEIHMDSYEDSQGTKRTSISVIAEDVEFLSSKAEMNAQGEPKEAYKKPEMVMVSEEEAGQLPF